MSEPCRFSRAIERARGSLASFSRAIDSTALSYDKYGTIVEKTEAF
jgi:hypothetical protein